MSGDGPAADGAGSRVELQGAKRSGEAFEFQFDGKPVTAFHGESVAASILASGHAAFRITRDGAPRAPFCGMGVCGECLVVIDGEPRRACLEKSAPGLKVSPSKGAAADRAPATAVARGVAPVTLQPQLLVVGAGPAGLTAALEAARCGVDVLVVDERSAPGGQFYKQPGEGFDIDPERLDAQFRDGRRLYREAVEAGVKFRFNALVWAGAADPLEIFAIGEDAALRIRPDYLVLAQGAYEICPMFPGWTLPGVMTTGAGQTFLRSYLTAPGRRVLIAGNGPLNLQLARELSDAGVEVAAVVETAPRPGAGAIAELVTMAANAPDLMAQGAGHISALMRRGVEIIYSAEIIAAEGDQWVNRAKISAADGSRQRSFDVDAVCVGYGFAPQSEIARALGCDFTFDESRGALAAVRADSGRTNIERVYIVGDGGGLGGARAALAQGGLAGVEIAAALGRPMARDGAKFARSLARARGFQRALWRLYRAPSRTMPAGSAQTLICRCESVPLEKLQSVVAQGWRQTGSLKRATRAGMGRCQGRYCAAAIAALGRNAPPGALDFFSPRFPAKPVRLRDVAAFATLEEA